MGGRREGEWEKKEKVKWSGSGRVEGGGRREGAESVRI